MNDIPFDEPVGQASAIPFDEPIEGPTKGASSKLLAGIADTIGNSSTPIATMVKLGGKLATLGSQLSGNTEFIDTLKQPEDLWTKESIPAHLASAYQKGVFDKPIGELVQNSAQAVKDFKLSDLFDAAKAHPGKFAGELVNTVAADPYLLLPMFWEAFGGRLGIAGKQILGKLGEIGGKAAEVGVTGAGVGGVDSAARQLDEVGFVDPQKLSQDMKISAGLAATLSVLSGVAGSLGNTKPQNIIDVAQFHMTEGDDIMTAMNKAMETYDVPTEKAKSLVDELKKQVEAPDKDFAEMQKEVGDLIPKDEPVPEMTSKEALSDLGKQAEEMKARREAGQASEEDFSKMTEDLQQQEALRQEQENAPLELPEQPAADVGTQEGIDAQKRIQEGASVGEEPSALQARADFLQQKSVLTLSQAKDLQNIRSYLEVLPEFDAKEASKGMVTPGMRERGIIDPEMAKWIGFTMGGATIGGYLADDKKTGAMLGAALVLGGGIAAKAGKSLVRDGMEKLGQAKEMFASFKRDPAQAKQIADLISAHEGMVAAVGLASDRLAYSLQKLVPSAERRAELMHIIQGGQVRELRGNERAAAEIYQKEMAEFGDAGQKAGVLDDLISDGSYVTQLWKDEKKAKGFFSSVSGKSRFAEDRLIPNAKEGIAMGLEPQTMDIAEIARIYGNGLGRAMANKELLETLKSVKIAGTGDLTAIKEAAKAAAVTRKERFDAERLPETVSPIMPAKEAPGDFVALNHPQLQGYLVSPEMAPALSHLFYSTNIPSYLQAMSAVSAAAKQGLLSMSGFHAKSLLEVGAGIALGLRSPKTLTKIPEMYRMLKQGAAGDFADMAVRGGLKIEAHGFDVETAFAEKVANAVIKGIEKVPVLGKVASLPLKGASTVIKGMNEFLWDYLHPSIKLSTANVAYTKALERESERLAKDASYKAISPDQIMKEVTSTTNDLFGGLNWRQVSGEIENRFMHKLSSSLTNPEGLRYLRIGLLAPDWLASTVRAGYKGGKATLKSLIPGTKMTVGDDLYRRYFLGGAVLTATVMEGLQQHFTGTHFWDNEDPTAVYLADGRKIQVAKHYTEIFHWLREPAGTLVNKMGYLPKELGAQLLSKEYISPKGMPNMEDTSLVGRAEHAVKGMLPIGVQEAAQGRAMEGISGASGVPIHGKTRQEREEAKRRRQVEIARRQSRQQKRNR